MADLTKGDAGIVIYVTLNEDVSDATALQVLLRSPIGIRKTLTAGLKAGSDRIVEYTTNSTDFDYMGDWQAQVRVVQPGKDRKTSVFIIDVGQGFG